MDLVLALFLFKKDKWKEEVLITPNEEKGDLIHLLSHAKEEMMQKLKPDFLHRDNAWSSWPPALLLHVCHCSVTNLRFTGKERENVIEPDSTDSSVKRTSRRAWPPQSCSCISISINYLINSAHNRNSSSFQVWAILDSEVAFFLLSFRSMRMVVLENLYFEWKIFLVPHICSHCVLGWYLLTTWFTCSPGNHKCFISNVSQVFPILNVLCSHWVLQLRIIDGDHVDGVECGKPSSRFWWWNHIIKRFHYHANRSLQKGSYYVLNILKRKILCDSLSWVWMLNPALLLYFFCIFIAVSFSAVS